MRKFNEIKTRNELADFLNVPRKQLSYVLYKRGVDNLYTSFEIDKKNGSARKINAPLEELKGVQRKLAEALYKYMRNKWKKKNISHGFEKDKSIITNAKIHRNKRLVLNIDIEDFFESIHFGRVRGFFSKNNNFLLPIEVATVVAQISCYEGKLPQGAPSSPIISNLICEILDHRLLKIAKKYKLDYTRYADDLTFSTNDKKFLGLQKEFYKVISKELIRAGFKINEKKNRLQLRDSRQVVTGLVVNKKINVNRIYYKETRAMAHQLYKQGSFEINGEPATLNQLEGRFAFINQLTWYNNKEDGIKTNFNNFTSRERQYQRFLFYKYFFANPKPLIVTEGKTDVTYLKAALKSLYKEYPNLITKHSDGTFEFKVAFLKKTKRLGYFLGIYKDGGSALNNIYNFFGSKKPTLNYLNDFKKVSGNLPKNPVILMFDNEIDSGKKKPIGQFISHSGLAAEKRTILEREYMVDLIDSLYLLTVPLIGGKSECDIEDLFEKITLSHKIEGREFSKKDSYDTSKCYGKEIFSQYILKNYSDINFSEFRSLLNNINNIIDIYKKRLADTEHNLEAKNIDKNIADKVLLEI
ncbi:RNA-directed DNA polymerase [Bacillus sp. AR8-1]|uniref:retron Ec67 family RNA-directed DNA polymerase/endonuclease n=1 Tax=Bacillus sp. AR8-1 TaxID=2217826 RepID=UPI0011CAB3B8|nr:retron Ec67 family RNA-directed DNA polymerase/endonuclease [Bacillus sp. AR8-1]MED2914902.1 retron Ec67 family RNA-directed DNA polymerase/endonuclease [Bacillus thuringiensis]MED2922276.1 retron Ec67 family RNA-directed DNA polymerase/endonuclease [Bacillus thuringiensis]MED3050194.1 retron Ec67 family RNA-directed DNA polymerase/endonuclease [Bacillus thuringiensis]TXR76165.1 RNA-directed DNA polymerase [Bacillus sp. AR8-1]